MQALLWHILRDPSLGASLPSGGAGSWFVYRQHGVSGPGGVPDLSAVYRLDADELVLGGSGSRLTTRKRWTRTRRAG